MNIKKLLLFTLILLSISFFVPKFSKAADSPKTSAPKIPIILKIREGIEYFFAFRVERKIEVLDKQAETRLDMAQDYAKDGNNQKVQNLVQNYLQTKEKQDDLLDKISDENVLGLVGERTVEQQKTMEDIKTNVNQNIKNEIVQVQEQVVNQVAQRIVVTNGTEGQTEFFQKVEHVWAPGTGPGGGESGVVIEGGNMQFAPGTSAGGNSGADIKTVIIEGNP